MKEFLTSDLLSRVGQIRSDEPSNFLCSPKLFSPRLDIKFKAQRFLRLFALLCPKIYPVLIARSCFSFAQTFLLTALSLCFFARKLGIFPCRQQRTSPGLYFNLNINIPSGTAFFVLAVVALLFQLFAFDLGIFCIDHKSMIWPLIPTISIFSD